MAPRLNIPITADGRQARREVDQVAGKFGGLQSKVSANLKNIAAGFGVAFGGAALIGGVKSSINAASDLNETISKVGQVFGTAGDDVIAWSKNSSNALGQSQTAALDAASTFAVFGKGAGLAGKPLTEFSTELVGLSADFASFSNTSPEEAVNAIGAALRGETEPMRKFGLVLDQAKIQAEAFRLGLVATAKTPVDSGKRAIAVQSLVKQFAEGQNIAGDFARTSSGLANQQRILAAKVDNAKAAIGAGLLPVVLAGIQGITGFTNGIKAGVGWIQQNADVLVTLGSALAVAAIALNFNRLIVTTYGVAIRVVTAVTRAWAVATGIVNAVMSANPISLVVIAIAALVAGIVIAYQRSETFRAVVQAVWGAVRGAVSAAVGGILAALRSMVAFIGAIAGFVQTYLAPIRLLLLGPFMAGYLAVRGVIATLRAVFPTISAALRSAVSVVASVLGGPFRTGAAAVSSAIGTARQVVGTIGGAVRNAVSGVAGALSAPFRAGADAIRNAIGSVVGWVEGKIAGIRSVVSQGIDFARGLYNPFARTWNAIQITLPKVKIPLGPTLGGGTIGLPNIPELASGAYVTRATLAMIGEGRHPEVVAPEPMLRRVVREEAGRSGGGDTYLITITGGIDTSDGIARAVESVLSKRARRVGGVQLTGAHR